MSTTNKTITSSDVKKTNNEAFKTQKNFMEKDPIWKLVLKFSLPTILMFLAVAIYGISDTIMASVMTEGVYDTDKTAIIAIGYALSYIAILQAFAVLVNVGAVVRYSSLISKNDKETTKHFVGSTLSGSVIVNTTVTAVGLLIAPEILNLIAGTNAYISPGVHTEAYNAALLYTQIVGITVIFIGLYDLLIRYIRTEGNPNIAGLIGVSGLPINLFFNWIFMGVIGMGIEGGAIASVIGYGFTLLIAIGFVMNISRKNHDSVIFSGIKYLKPKWEHLSIALVLGIPAFTRNILMTINNFSFAAFTNHLEYINPSTGLNDPEFFSTGSSIYSQLTNIISSMMRGITQGAVAVLSYNYAKQNFDNVRNGVKWMFIYMTINIALISAIIFPLVPILADLLSFGTASAYGSDLNYLIYSMITSTMIFGFLLCMFGFMNSTKQIKNSVVASIINSVLVFFAVVTPMMMLCPWETAVWSLTIAYGVSIAILLPFTIYILKNLDKVYAKSSLTKK